MRHLYFAAVKAQYYVEPPGVCSHPVVRSTTASVMRSKSGARRLSRTGRTADNRVVPSDSRRPINSRILPVVKFRNGLIGSDNIRFDGAVISDRLSRRHRATEVVVGQRHRLRLKSAIQEARLHGRAA